MSELTIGDTTFSVSHPVKLAFKQLQLENEKLRKDMKDAGLLTEEEYNKWKGGVE